MKKIVCFIISTFLLLNFYSCGSSERNNPRSNSSDITSEDKTLGRDALKIIDSVLDKETNYENAYKKLESICDKFSNKDSLVETDIFLASFTVKDFYDELNDTTQEKLERKLLLERNEIADEINEKYRNIIIKEEPLPVNLKELATNSDVYNLEYITTTIKVSEKESTPNYWEYKFNVVGLNSEQSNIVFVPDGFSVNIPDSEYVTVTGIAQSYSIDNDISVYITAINSNAVSKDVDKSLFSDLSKVSAGSFFKNKDKTEYDDYDY